MTTPQLSAFLREFKGCDKFSKRAIIPLVKHTDSGRFVFQNADGFNNPSYWAKHPLLADYRPAVCLTSSAASKGFFVMTKDWPCVKCGAIDWLNCGKCRPCNQGAIRRFKENNPDYASEWYQENKEKVKARGRKWERNNPAKVSAKFRRWKSKNPDRISENGRRYRQENREKINESARGRYKKDPQRYISSVQEWQHNNPGKVAAIASRRRTRKTEAGGSYTAAEFKALCELYDNCCVCCGQEKPLTFDHVIPVSKGGSSDISNGQPMCRPCNSKKYNKTTDYRTKPGISRWIQEKLL